MTHFDFKTLLPALLQVEDRVSMAHGLESRVPFLDTDVVEFAATLPADVKFKDGHLKHALKRALDAVVPAEILDRTDKMGFPVPLARVDERRAPRLRARHALEARGTRRATYSTTGVRPRDGDRDRRQFGRKLWGLLSLELWQREFHDRQSSWSCPLELRRLPGGSADLDVRPLSISFWPTIRRATRTRSTTIFRRSCGIRGTTSRSSTHGTSGAAGFFASTISTSSCFTTRSSRSGTTYFSPWFRDTTSSAYDGLKVQFLQDEYRWVDGSLDMMRNLEIDVLYSVVPPRNG